ncbi:MAG: class I SAM-dependent methyltransferase [Verrucomicrobia bacterium]|nr:class I SAM-dependent methyltransferase [Verrucomicrobiota bacterium]
MPVIDRPVRCLPLLERPAGAAGEDDPAAPAAAAPFTAMGNFVCALLVSLGLEPGQLVVDVGCGTGWLAPQLATIPRLRYLGTDVSAALLRRTCAAVRRDHWQFLRAAGDASPCAADTADFVCLNSLFSHLLPSDAARHLADAARVLRPGGHIVFPFFDFSFDRDAIHARARIAGLHLDRLCPADRPLIPLEELFPWPADHPCGTSRCIGQSVAVLLKPQPPRHPRNPSP